MRAYLEAADGLAPRRRYPTLERNARWQLLARAFDDPTVRAKLYVFDQPPKACPRCCMRLPRACVEELQQSGIASCCGRLLLSKAY